MDYDKITSETLPAAVEIALEKCLSLRSGAGNNALIRDLDAAIYALQLVKSELQGHFPRAKNQRSAAFTRYVIDEDNQMAMADDLKNFIVKIEEAYKRY